MGLQGRTRESSTCTVWLYALPDFICSLTPDLETVLEQEQELAVSWRLKYVIKVMIKAQDSALTAGEGRDWLNC